MAIKNRTTEDWAAANADLRKRLERARVLVPLLTLQQVANAGGEVLKAAAQEDAPLDVVDDAPDAQERHHAVLLREMERLRTLVGLVTVGQVMAAGDVAIDAAGLSPWCVNDGRASKEDRLGTWWLAPPASAADGAHEFGAE